MVRRLTRRRRGDRRQDQLARDRPLAVHRGPGLRRDPQPLEPRSHARAAPPAARPPRSPPGWSPAALGSDGAGSVRIPAAWTNLVGIKPQRGRISTWPDPEAFNGLTCHRAAGPHRRRRRAAARRRSPATSTATSTAAAAGRALRRRRAHASPGRLRIALSFTIPFSVAGQLDPEHPGRGRALAAAARGASATRSCPPTPTTGWSARRSCRARWPGSRAWCASACPTAPARPADAGERPHRPAARRPAAARRPPRRAAGLRRRVGRDLPARRRRAHADHRAAAAAGSARCDGLGNWETDKRSVAACPYAWPWNVLGWPGVNVPAGFTAAGLPIGAQLLGPAERAAPARARRPARGRRALAGAAPAGRTSTGVCSWRRNGHRLRQRGILLTWRRSAGSAFAGHGPRLSCLERCRKRCSTRALLRPSLLRSTPSRSP